MGPINFRGFQEMGPFENDVSRESSLEIGKEELGSPLLPYIADWVCLIIRKTNGPVQCRKKEPAEPGIAERW